MSDFVFPEDTGTGAIQGDKNDAANFAALSEAIGLSDYVASGLQFTLNSSTPSLDVSSGKAVLSDSSASASQTSEVRDEGVSFVAELDSRSGLSLTDNAVNHVYIDVNLSSDDDITIVINTTGSAPSQPSLKIGEVDTSSDTVTLYNRETPIEADNLLGNNGSSGKFLESTGSGTTWSSPSSEQLKTVSNDYTTSGETTLLLKSYPSEDLDTNPYTYVDTSTMSGGGIAATIRTDGVGFIVADSSVLRFDSNGNATHTKSVPDRLYTGPLRLNNSVWGAGLNGRVMEFAESDLSILTNQQPYSKEVLSGDVGPNDYLYFGINTTNNDVKKVDTSINTQWTYSPTDSPEQLIVDGSGNVYIGTRTGVEKIDQSPSQQWSDSTTDIITGLALDGSSRLFALQYGKVISYDAATGNRNWSKSFTKYQRCIQYDDKGNLYVGGDQGVRKLDPATGDVLSSWTAGHSGIRSVVIKYDNNDFPVGLTMDYTTPPLTALYTNIDVLPQITLSSSDASSGKIVRVIDVEGIASKTSTDIVTEASEKIMGEDKTVLQADYEGLTLQSDGGDWYVISRTGGGTK